VATPERLSLQVKVTLTFVLFQPLALGAGEAAPAVTLIWNWSLVQAAIPLSASLPLVWSRS